MEKSLILERCEEIYTGILERLQDICIRNGIDMWLTGSAALSAYRDGSLNCDDLAVCVQAKDVPRLERAIKAEADGSFDVESPMSNENYPAYELRVFDPRTTDCDASAFFKYENNCMHVTVKPTGTSPKKSGKAERLFGRLNKKLLGQAKTFEKWCESQSPEKKKLQPVDVNGHSFFIPEDKDAFFTGLFGPGWQFLELPEFMSSDKHFRSADRSWKEWSEGISATEIKAYEWSLKNYRDATAGHRDAQRVLTKVHNIVDLSYDRIQLYKKLGGREDELKALLNDGRFGELETELKPYLSKAKRYLDKGLGLYIDDVLAELADGLLRHNGMEQFADGLRKLMPENKAQLMITDHHGKALDKLPDTCITPVDADELPDGVLSETQLRLLDMMKRVHEFLSENGIEYFLFGGSLLGAIRHNGFIPWDDDMDIVMDRANYYKLVEISDRLPWDDIAFDCCEKNPGFHKPFGMFTLLTDTRFVNDRVYFGGAGLGTGIDVFIMDNVPFEALDEYLKTSLLYQEVQTDETIKCADIFKYSDEYFECKKQEKTEGKAAVVAQLRAEMEKYGPKKPEDYQVVRLWAKKPRIYEPGMMEKPVLHKFEDAEFPVPEKAVECLRMQYGSDWNVIPPHESRKIHAFKIDYELAACNYYRLVDEEVNWAEVSEALDRRKQSRLKALDKKQEIDSFRKTLYAKFKDNV